MKASQMMPSKYLKKEDIDRDTLVTIAKLGQADVSQQDAGEEDLKWTVKFKELDKPLVLNVTNINAITEATGTDETDEWVGKQVVLYVDPNVMFAGKRVGGLRIRAPKNKVLPTGGKGKPAPTEDPDDQIPF